MFQSESLGLEYLFKHVMVLSPFQWSQNVLNNYREINIFQSFHGVVECKKNITVKSVLICDTVTENPEWCGKVLRHSPFCGRLQSLIGAMWTLRVHLDVLRCTV